MMNLSWDTVESADAVDPPDRPGVYAWMRDDEVVFVGAARSLHKRILGELGPSRGRPRSPLRERVALHLIRDVHAAVPWRGEERGSAVDGWLRECSVAWKAMPLLEAELQVEHVLDIDLPRLHRWRPRPREDEWLASYLRRAASGGVTYTEVPIGGGPGSSLRRIDAVRVCRDQSLDVRYFDPRRFERDVRGEILEVIEVKESLNRPVVGQLIVARDLIDRQWREVAAVHLVAIVARDDALIHELCSEVYDIRVEVIHPERSSP
jgi:hypothetical protein